MRSSKLHTALQISTILAVAFALKYHYSTASVNGLRWMLAPTTFLVELITGTGFRFESHAGYLSDDRTFLIAASCAGVNFLIISFLMLNLGTLVRERKIDWFAVLSSLVVSYFATLIANTVRITIALRLQKLDADLFGLNGEELHRFEGIAVYFGCLVLLFLVSEKFAAREGCNPSTLVRRSLIPLSIYYAAMLAVPLMGGAYRDPMFWQHAGFVILIPPVLVLLLVLPAVCRSVIFPTRG